MTFKEFNEFLKENLANYQNFYDSALNFQNEKNSTRKKRWSDYKIEKAVNEMWDNVANNMYTQIKKSASDEKMSMIDFINSNDILESINESMSDIEFNEE